MRRPRAIALFAAWMAMATGIVAVPCARAEFGPIQLVSKSAKEQAAYAEESAISTDGRFVVFAGRIGGREGVFRKDLQTGAIALVSEIVGVNALKISQPSVSADGRYVAFTTESPLDPADDPEANSRDVYVADMNSTPPTYELASAANGSAEALGGSTAAGRVALSEAGNRLAFVHEGEVYVRELGTTRTILITVTMGGTGEEPVPGGGADPRVEGAALSGDGSTVAWVGLHLPDQVPMLTAEAERIRALEGNNQEDEEVDEYHEPLWRRVPSPVEPDPPTRRVVGGGDPLAPGCPPGGTISDPACQGPFPDLTKERLFRETRSVNEGVGWGNKMPQLDRDGDLVATIGSPDEDPDLFLVNMAPGLSRLQATRRLTQFLNPDPGNPNQESIFSGVDESARYFPFVAPIEECAISPEGNRIAFTTLRQRFPLSPPTLTTALPPGPSVQAELYQVDLTGETIERVTPGNSGAVSNGKATAPSYSDEGRFLAFTSGASNLVEGDTNGKTDAFVVESPPPAPELPTTISPHPPSLFTKPLWRITVAAASLPNGRLRISVGVPGGGVLKAKAAAKVGRKLRQKQVAAAHRTAGAAGLEKLELHLPGPLHSLAKRKGGLYARLDVNFNGSGGKPLRAALEVHFLVHKAKKRKKKR